tara:strand:- start:54 stop:626 length:573 start_codon:yes stop_codon:yes gene_type:complete
MKFTTQKAPLEKLLSYLRYKRTIEFIKNKKVLDFGCGISNWNAKFIGKYPKFIHGVDSSLSEFERENYLIEIFKDIKELPISDYEVVLSMAVFEHIEPFNLITILDQIYTKTSQNAIIFGTTPTPLSRPILETLSYKLKLIDKSQISDHKVYYDDFWLKSILTKTNWTVKSYRTFQLGMNSEFILGKDII